MGWSPHEVIGLIIVIVCVMCTVSLYVQMFVAHQWDDWIDERSGRGGIADDWGLESLDGAADKAA